MARSRFCFAALVAMLALSIAVPNATAIVVRTAMATPGPIIRAQQLVGVPLPPTGGFAPSATAPLFHAPLTKHVVLGFIGAAGFSGVTSAELMHVSEFVTNMTNLTATGVLSTKTPGWSDLNDPNFPSFVTNAHNAADRVLLGIASGSRATLARMLRGPADAAARLAGVVMPLLAADHLDGVDLDIEGGTIAERGAFTTFTTVLERTLPPDAAELVVNVTPSAASTSGFFNVAALGRVASALFVMDYDMTPGGQAGPNAPLNAAAPQVSDLSSLVACTRVVPAAKLLLGIPFYGYDFPTKTSAPGSATIGPAESVTYANIVAVGHVGHWDATSLTPYYVFRRGKQWHETYYDDPVSVALKVALASVLHLSGVGVWSLGQEGSSSTMLTALDGGGSPRHLRVAT